MLDNNGKEVDHATWKVNAGKGEVIPEKDKWGGSMSMLSLTAKKVSKKKTKLKTEL